MDLPLVLLLLPLLLALLGVRDLWRGGARDILPHVMGVVGLLLTSAVSFTLLAGTAGQVPALLAPLLGIPFLWAGLDQVIPRRLKRLREALEAASAEGTLTLVVRDDLDRMEARDGRKGLGWLSGLLVVVMGIGGLELGSGLLLAGSALSALYPLARLARWRVEDEGAGTLRRTLARLESAEAATLPGPGGTEAPGGGGGAPPEDARQAGSHHL